ncbi:MAG: translation elongation factor Ts [Chloroflexi bacterium]|nr:translation elongation factor Ts [Chloroflexota bacterium]
MDITVEQIKELREITGAGVLDAKKALIAAEGNMDKAVDALREKGLARMAKRADRTANEGIIEMYAHLANRVGVMLELNSESDFVARTDLFRNLAHEIALHIAAMDPKYLSREDVPRDEIDRELEVLRAQALAEGKPEQVVERIVSGRLEKFYQENVLLEQPFVKDDSKTVKDLIDDVTVQLGENIVLRRFVRYELGEAI